MVAPASAKWHETFWDNLAASIGLHGIKSVIAIDHRDCGAARIAYGDASVATHEMPRPRRIARRCDNSDM